MDNHVDIYRDYGNPPKIPEEFKWIESTIRDDGIYVSRMEDGFGNFIAVVVHVPMNESCIMCGIINEFGKRSVKKQVKVDFNINGDIGDIIKTAKYEYSCIKMRYGSNK
ncbi:MAG: hypothetical protein J6C50_03035 [Rickettsiales bacterium]|nr:hypothetical protein [Rickettsiales bacterium]